MTAHVTHVPATHEKPSPAAGALAGTGQLIRLALRRDRIVLPVWALVVAFLAASGASAFEALYPNPAERAGLTASVAANPSFAIMFGPAYDLETAGGFTAWRFGTIAALLTSLIAAFTVTRHTRQEEDTGRQELLSSAVVGRYAPLTAGVTTAGLFSVATGVLLAAMITGVGVDATGSVAFGAAVALCGLVFTGVAAVTAQLAEYSRTANTLAGSTFGVLFLLRAAGDTSDAEWLSWLSPVGWVHRVRAFAENDWWVLALPAAATLVLCAAAYALLPRRDVGMSLIPGRPGRAAATPGLRTSLALSWRLHRGALLGWIVGFGVMGMLFGTLASGVGDLVGDSAEMKRMLQQMGGARGIEDAFLSSITGMVAMIGSMYAVQATLRMRYEETALRVEPLLTTGVGRLRWLGGHLLFVLAGTAAVLAVCGALLGLGYGLSSGDVTGEWPRVFGATLAQLPAMWVVAGAAVVLFGLVPRATAAVWALAAAFVLISMFGPILELPQAVLNVSPFAHVPQLPHAEFSATPLLWLTATAAALVAVGVTALRRRDIG